MTPLYITIAVILYLLSCCLIVMSDDNDEMNFKKMNPFVKVYALPFFIVLIIIVAIHLIIEEFILD